MKRYLVLGALVGGVLAGGIGTAAVAATPAEVRLQRVEDHIAIERLLVEYGRDLDNRDFDAYAGLFAKNGSWSGSLGTFTGPAAIKAGMLKAFPGAVKTTNGNNFHLVTNPIIDIDGDTATAVSKWTFVRMVDKTPIIALSGSYADKLVREGGTWKFLSRVATTPPAGPAPKTP